MDVDPAAAVDVVPAAMDVDVSGPGLRWVNLSSDIIGSVLRLLPLHADRARLRSVCRAWRDAARIEPPPPSLPLLVFPNLDSSSFSPSQETIVSRRFLLPEAVAGREIRCVGSFEGWLVGTQPSSQVYDADGECFLLNAFSQDVVRLPQPCAFHFFDYSRKSIPIANSSAMIVCTIHRREYAMKFDKVVLSASPDSSSRYVVAATAANELALWQPGMTSWCVCETKCTFVPSDMAFYKGKLYLVSNYSANILSFEFEDDPRMMISRVEQCSLEPLPPVNDSKVQRRNIVEWRGRLLLVVRYGTWKQTFKIGVFALDLSTNPHSITEINSLDGDCLFISSCCSKSFPACQYDVVEGDFVYFTTKSQSFEVLRYNMRDASMATISFNGLHDESDVSKHSLVWFFPPE